MIESQHFIANVLAGLSHTSFSEVVSVILGLLYSLLAVKRSRWCWVAGGAGSALAIYVNATAHLPMQAALQVYYVVISVHGFWYWTRNQGEATRTVSVWPLRYHLAVCGLTLAISALTARWLAAETSAAWSFLDSLTTWGSLFATWLTARVKLENWLYWLAIDGTLMVLYTEQGLYFFALLSLVYLGVSAVGFAKWLKTYRNPVPAVPCQPQGPQASQAGTP